MTSGNDDLVHCTEEELTKETERFDGRRIEAVGLWISGNVEDCTFAELGVEGAESFRYRHYLGRRFGALEVRMRGRVEMKAPTSFGRRRGVLRVEHVEPLAEIVGIVDGELVRGPVAITRETGFFCVSHTTMAALRHLPMKLGAGKAIVREGPDGGLEIAGPDGSVVPIAEGSTFDDDTIFTRDRRSREAWSFVQKSLRYRVHEPPYVVIVDGAKDYLVVPPEGASYACSRDRIEQTTPDDGAANLEIFRVGDRYVVISPRGELYHRHLFSIGELVVGVETRFTAGNCAVRLVTKHAFEKRAAGC